MKVKILVILVVILLGALLTKPAFAERIALKSGKTIEGKIIKKTDKYIKVDISGVSLTYFMDQLESIDGKQIISEASANAPVSESGSLNTASAFFEKGYKCIANEDYSNSVSYFKKAIDLDTNYVNAHAYLGLAYYYLNDYPQAKDNFIKSKKTLLSEDLRFVDKYLGII